MIEHNKGEGLTFRGQVLVELFPHDWNTAQLNELGVWLLEYMADNLSSLQPVRDAFKERAVEIDIEPLLMEMVKVAADFMDKSEMTAKMIQKARNEKKKQIESEAYQAGISAELRPELCRYPWRTLTLASVSASTVGIMLR